MLIFWLHAATGGAHYFFFFLKAARSDPSILPSPSASSLLCLPFKAVFLPDFLAVFLQAPLHPGFEQPHPHDLHIIFYLSYEGSFYARLWLPSRLL